MSSSAWGLLALFLVTLLLAVVAARAVDCAYQHGPLAALDAAH